MIIFGTRNVTSTDGEGTFHCPECRARKYYAHRKVRKFFTLYFMPIFPLEHLGEYVECLNCRGTYKTKVLEYDPDENPDGAFAKSPPPVTSSPQQRSRQPERDWRDSPLVRELQRREALEAKAAAKRRRAKN